jgi:hypothetical protein
MAAILVFNGLEKWESRNGRPMSFYVQCWLNEVSWFLKNIYSLSQRNIMLKLCPAVVAIIYFQSIDTNN